MSDEPAPRTLSASGDLLERLKYGTPAEQEAILDELLARARAETADAVDVNEYAFALATIGRHSDAVAIWEALLEAAPDNAIARMNLSVSLSQLGHLELAHHHMAYVAEHGSEDERGVAQGQIAALERFMEVDAENGRFVALQLAALRERRAAGGMSKDDRMTLARRLYKGRRDDPDATGLREAALVLEEGLLAEPDSVPMMELLAACYLRHDPETRLEDLVARLERLAPDSPLIEILSDQRDAPADRPATEDRVNELMSLVTAPESDDAVRAAAVADLSSVVSAFPDNPSYRSSYAFALAMTGRHDEARAQALRAGESAGESHSVHFNVAQVLWATGNQEAAERHLHQARRFAHDEQDLRDVEFVAGQWAGHG
jgi:Flp pilus assembly protein TadD